MAPPISENGRRSGTDGRRTLELDRWATAPEQVPFVEDDAVDETEAEEADALADNISAMLQDVAFPIPLHRLIDEAGERVVEMDDGSVRDLVELLGGVPPQVFRSLDHLIDVIQTRLDLEARGERWPEGGP